MTGPGPQAFFLPAAQGQRYCLYHAAHGTPRSMVLHVHPLAEELNKTRRIAALQARALAAAGHAVLQIDLLGCGDSAGDFADARWPLWIDDLLLARQWLAQAVADVRTDPRAAAGAGAPASPGDLPLWWWGVRGGCLLAADAARALAEHCHLLFWQASFADGAAQLQQFLRLRLAGDLLAAPDGAPPAKGRMEALLQQLAQGDTLEIAGYALHGALATGLQASRLTPPRAHGTTARMVWLDTSTAAAPSLSPLAKRVLAQWQQAGWQAHAQVLQGPAFWQSVETEEAPALLATTLAALDAGDLR